MRWDPGIAVYALPGSCALSAGRIEVTALVASG
jgi:hypothetical protein